MSANVIVSVREKIAYGLGDTASNIVFQTVLLFQLYFYTEIFGLAPAVVGTLFLVVRVFDAITDPLMGAWTDHVKTKYGKYRPFLLWLALPFGLITVAAFTTPDWGDTEKMIYAFVTYTALMTIYTAINIPYCALGGVLTSNPDERVSIQTYRFIFGMLGGVIVAALTMKGVEYFGGGDEAKGYQHTMIAMSVFGVGLFLMCFAGTKERVTTPKEQNSRIRDDLSALLKNDQWRVLSGIALMVLTGIVMRTTLAAIYGERVLPVDSVSFAGMDIDIVTAIIVTGMVGNISGVSLATIVAKRVSKIVAYRYIQIAAALISVASFFIPPSMVGLVLFAWFVWNFTLQIGTPLLWAKMADVVDYGHLKTGIRVNATVYSTIIFFIKAGIAVGGAAAAWLLAFYGYDPKETITQDMKDGITLSFTIFPAIPFLIVAWLTRFYTLTDERVREIQKELPEAVAAE